MTKIRRLCVLAVLALGPVQGMAQAANQPVLAYPLCQAPVTRAYRIQPNFCPSQLVAMIPHSVAADSWSGCCRPYGIPPIYTAGNHVVVRQSPEVHERIAKFLSDIGALVPYQPAQ